MRKMLFNLYIEKNVRNGHITIEGIAVWRLISGGGRFGCGGPILNLLALPSKETCSILSRKSKYTLEIIQ